MSGGTGGAFATGASVGCPPDLVFTKGQNWGFPPLHPDRQREDGYTYLIASFRNHLRYANALRIDHVMGLHRLFWIPDNAEAKYGAYVATPADEIYAILSVESHRRKAWLVGEDLGTVPPAVESAMNRHAVAGMYVVQYELRPEPAMPLRPVPATTVASVNTHDMPPFAAFWSGIDLADRQSMGLLDGDALHVETASRSAQKEALVHFLKGEGKIPAEGRDRRPGRRPGRDLAVAGGLDQPRPPPQRRGSLAGNRVAEYTQHLDRAGQLAAQAPPSSRSHCHQRQLPQPPDRGRRRP